MVDKMTEYKKYICQKCNYRFRFKHGTTKALRCPYCANTQVAQDRFDLNRLVESL